MVNDGLTHRLLTEHKWLAPLTFVLTISLIIIFMWVKQCHTPPISFGIVQQHDDLGDGLL